MSRGAPTSAKKKKSNAKELIKVSFNIERGVFEKLGPYAEKAYMNKSQLMRKILAEFIKDMDSDQRRF